MISGKFGLRKKSFCTVFKGSITQVSVFAESNFQSRATNRNFLFKATLVRCRHVGQQDLAVKSFRDYFPRNYIHLLYHCV